MARSTDKLSMGVLVFEKQPYWGPELMRQFTDQQVLVRECRSVRDLMIAGESLSAIVRVIVLDAAPMECLGWMTEQFHANTRCPFVVIASSAFADLEWAIREAGATGFLDDEIAGHCLARLCRRLLRGVVTSGVPVAALAGQ